MAISTGLKLLFVLLLVAVHVSDSAAAFTEEDFPQPPERPLKFTSKQQIKEYIVFDEWLISFECYWLKTSILFFFFRKK